MFKFYLRQTTPFSISDILKIIKEFVFIKNIDKQLTKEISRITESKYVIFSSSMRSILLKSLEFFKKEYPEKTELIIPEYSFHSNLSSAIKNNYVVKFATVDHKTLFIDEKKLKKLVTKKTLGIIITHLHGQIYDLNKIKEIIDKHNLIIFEDCAHSFPANQALAKKYYNNSSLKFLSFGPGKFVTAFGGGALACNNQKLFKYINSSIIKSDNNLIDNIITLIKVCLYIIITQPIIAYFTLKPILALSYLLKNKKVEDDSFDRSIDKPKSINGMNKLQKNLLFLQLIDSRLKVKKIIKKRQKNAQYWSQKFVKKQLDSSFSFQLPIAVNNRDDFIWKMWRQNIDVQIDYCSYLPKLVTTSKSFSTKKINFFKSLVYLPTNQYLSKEKIEKIII